MYLFFSSQLQSSYAELYCIYQFFLLIIHFCFIIISPFQFNIEISLLDILGILIITSLIIYQVYYINKNFINKIQLMQENNFAKARIRKNSRDGINVKVDVPLQHSSTINHFDEQPSSAFNYRAEYYKLGDHQSKIGERTMESYINQKYFSNETKQGLKQTDRSRNKQKQRASYLESEINAESSHMRLSTDELIPSFRQKYEIYELLHEISDYKRTLQLKNKQIFYLSNQIVSVKDQLTQKILNLESVISENKRELTELRYSGLKNKKMESEKGDKIVDQQKKNYQLQIHRIKQANQQLIQKLNEQHRKQMQNAQQKFLSMLNIEKRQKTAGQEVFQQKCRNLQAIIKQLEGEIQKLKKIKQEQEEEYKQIQMAADRLKEQFKQFSDKSTNQEKQLKIENQKLKSQISMLQQSVSGLKKEIKKITQQSKLEIKELEQSSKLNKEEIKKMKQILVIKDKEITRLIQTNNNKSHAIKKQEPINTTRSCNHEALIVQFERNIQFKNKQNQELRQQLAEWGKYIGFDHSSQDRISSVLNASSQALQAQQNLNQSIRKKFSKYST